MAKGGGGGVGVYFFREFIKKCTPLKFNVLKIVPPKKIMREKCTPPPGQLFPWSQAGRTVLRF